MTWFLQIFCRIYNKQTYRKNTVLRYLFLLTLVCCHMHSRNVFHYTRRQIVEDLKEGGCSRALRHTDLASVLFIDCFRGTEQKVWVEGGRRRSMQDLCKAAVVAAASPRPSPVQTRGYVYVCGCGCGREGGRGGEHTRERERERERGGGGAGLVRGRQLMCSHLALPCKSSVVVVVMMMVAMPAAGGGFGQATATVLSVPAVARWPPSYGAHTAHPSSA